jgi:cell wall-associated NlpC family hydrolase
VETLNRDYNNILTPTQLGDTIFLATRDGVPVHAAVYIADDIVFTKNGGSLTQPWILMHMQDMLDTYAVKYPRSGPLKIFYYRKKTL